MDISGEYINGKDICLDLNDQLELVDELALQTSDLQTTESRVSDLPIEKHKDNFNELHQSTRVCTDESLQQLRLDL